ncbi:MAG: aminopeptidase P family protein [Dehalococcoidia bacterium]|nr:aminopeptidase P family protein [Dehalococcoidia bacterium]
MKERTQLLVATLPEKELDAVLISAPENRRYLSGFTGSSGWLLLSQGQPVLITDSRYTEQAGHQAPDYQVIQSKGGGWAWLLELLKSSGIRRLGFESQNMTVATHQGLLDALKADADLGKTSLVPTAGLTEELRIIKDAEELVLLQKAIDASDSAMTAVCPAIRAGMTEREVAWRMEVAMREFGADCPSFDTIVAAGPNGAMAHHMPSDQRIQAGEPIVIDMGARVGGYCSDITRTVVVGEPDEMFRKIYDIVLGAQLTAMHAVKPGLTGEECDGLSRSVIADAGYGENFGHSLGHGVGLAVHEYPRVGPKATDVLKPDMVFTIEPGIYITGWGGVRIEDIVLLGAKGATPMSKAAK